MNKTEKKLTGIELIAEERREQIEKHGFSVIHDKGYYKNSELIQAALFCIDQATSPGLGLRTNVPWPKNWDKKFEKKIRNKDNIGRLKVAGAFIATEIDRILTKSWSSQES